MKLPYFFKAVSLSKEEKGAAEHHPTWWTEESLSKDSPFLERARDTMKWDQKTEDG